MFAITQRKNFKEWDFPMPRGEYPILILITLLYRPIPLFFVFQQLRLIYILKKLHLFEQGMLFINFIVPFSNLIFSFIFLRKRTAVLSYHHPNGGALLRSSQPKRGVTGNNSRDETYLEILSTLGTSQEEKRKKSKSFSYCSVCR